MSRSRKGLKRHGMRAYLVEGPRGSFLIVRDRPYRFFVRDAAFGMMPDDFFALKFQRLRAARQWAEQEAGLVQG